MPSRLLPPIMKEYGIGKVPRERTKRDERDKIDKTSFETVSEQFTFLKEVTLVATTGQQKRANIVQLQTIRIEDSELNIEYAILTDLDGINQHLTNKLDGVLGSDFLSQFKISLNYEKKTMSIWKIRRDLISRGGI